MSTRRNNDTNAATLYPSGTLRPALVTENDSDSHAALPEPLASDLPATHRFRPRYRPPVPVLRVADDGQETAEAIRIRQTPFKIGRTDGDLIVPVDAQMSSQHAEILLKNDNGRQVWCLRDLGSRNGTFVRVSQLVVSSERTVLIGGARFRIHTDSSETDAPSSPPNRTQCWPSGAPQATSPSVWLAEVGNGPCESKRYPLLSNNLWIGRDPAQCSIVLDDPLVSPRHARIWRDERGKWQLENAQSLNGIWAQIDDVALDRDAAFQCGEQRFFFRLD